MHQFWHAFDNYDYDYLCIEISNLRKNKNEYLEYFLTRFVHLCYIFSLDDRISTYYLISCLFSITNETYESVDEKYKSCFNVHLHADLVHENIENVNGLVGFICLDIYLLWGVHIKERIIF